MRIAFAPWLATLRFTYAKAMRKSGKDLCTNLRFERGLLLTLFSARCLRYYLQPATREVLMNFVHLHVHTEYSLIDGVVRIKPLLDQAMANKMPAVAITDHANVFGMVKFYQAALSKGVKPLIGAELAIVNEADHDKPFALVVLCQNQTGYNHLCVLLSRAYQEGQHHGKPMIRKEWLTNHTEGLIALSGAVRGDIGGALLAGDEGKAGQLLQAWQQLFPNRFYLELQRTGRAQEETYVQAALDLAEKVGVPVVATNDVRFLEAEEFEAHEARVCIHDGYVLSDNRRPRAYSQEQYFRSAQEMWQLFADVPSALTNTVEIAKRCNLELTIGENFLPNFPVPEGMTVESYLETVSKQGLDERLSIILPEVSSEQRKPYDDRLAIELQVINQMGFPGYFLIVADFIQWAKDNGIPVGPGRGSGAGSLVAYALKITDLDPLQFDLLFERFLNPERVSMPDFDIDFCMDGRDRVIDYVAQKYGRGSVSQIITFGTMAAKAVVRDVGRVLDFPYGFVDKVAKLIPFELGMTLTKALQEPALQERYENDEEVRTIIDLAMELEGLSRNAGKHAGGVVIAPGKLTDFTPLYCEEGSDHPVTQFDKDDVEAIGLVKFDFLGLRTLTIIDWAVQAINERLPADKEKIDISLIPFTDEASFKLLKSCQTTAVFQLESRGMKDLIKRLQPDCFEDIVALVALFRPGPLQSGMVDDFIDRKHGRAKVVYPHPKLEPILKPTYGVILYQEQVMQIAQVLAGYSLGAADILRRAMGKKKPEEMAKQRKIFTEGAVANQVDEKTATLIFDLMEKFAGYGFNKSHSAAYALVAYQTAWLKAHYQAEFMAAVLSSDMDNTDKVVIFIEECKALGLEVLPPDINAGQIKFTVNEAGQIVFGLGAIKGVGESALACVIAEREEGGAYQGLFDFCRRVDSRKVTKRVLEALIKSGALDQLGPYRAAMMASLPNFQQAAEQHLENEARNQNDLFAVADEQEAHNALAPEFLKIDRWTARSRLQYEKETLGFYLTGHPFDLYAAEIRQFVATPLVELKRHVDSTMSLAGLITGVRKLKTKRGKLIVIVTLDDCSARVEATFFSEIYEQSQQAIEVGQVLIVEGEVSHDDFSGGVRVVAKRCWGIDQARALFAKRIRLRLSADAIEKGFAKRLAQLLAPYQGGNCPVFVQYDHGKGKALLPLGSNWCITPQDNLLQALRNLLPGEKTVQLEY